MQLNLKKIPNIAAVKQIGFYFSANIFKAALPFMILPLMTRYLSPTDYGLWNIYLAIMAFILPLTACGLPTVIARNFHQHDQKEHSEMVFSAMSAIGGFSILTFILITIYSLFYDEFMSIPSIWLLAMPILCFMQNLQYMNKIILCHENRAKFFAFLDISNVAALRVGGLILVMYYSANWLSLMTANVIAQIIFAIIALYILLKDNHLKPIWNWAMTKGLILMGWPLIAHTVGAIIMTLSDRLILEKMTTTQDVGIYSLGANLGAAVLIVCTAFNQKWGPWMHRQMKEITETKKIRIVRYTYLYFALVALTTIGATIAGLLYIHYLIDPSYAQAADYVLWIAAGTGFFGMSLAVNHYLLVQGKTTILPLITGASAIINFILTIVLIKLNGPIGAAQATFIAYVFHFFAMWYVNNKHYPMPWLSALKKS